MTSHDIPTFPAFTSWLMRLSGGARVDAKIYRQAAIHPTGIGHWRSSWMTHSRSRSR